MANEDHLAILNKALEKEAISIWNIWRKRSPNIQIDLSEANLSEANLNYANLRSVNLRSVNLSEAILSEAILYSADLTKADLRSADLRSADLRSADLRSADLRLTNLRSANLSEANLISANLSEAILTKADLRSANLNSANLSEANLSEANLISANLSEANLSEAILHSANLHSANLRSANLHSANFQNAFCAYTSFDDVDLSKALNLGQVVHRGPSTIGIDTLEKSKGNIPDVFLRGCGVSETIITFAHSLVGTVIDFYSCFISYSTADEDFVKLLFDKLQGAGIRCWFAPEQILPGQRIDDAIDRGIRYWDKVLFCASKSSLTEKWWVDFEVDKAFKKSRDLQRKRGEQVGVIIPLNLDGHLFSDEYADNPKQSVFETTLAADFVGYDKDLDKFNREAERVIRALQTDGGNEEPPEPKL